MSRVVKIVVVAVAAVLVAGVAGFAVWYSGEDERQQRALAERLAVSFSELTVAPADWAEGELNPADELAEIVRGTRGIKPAVTVASLARGSGSESEPPVATLHWAWTPTPGLAEWSYDSVVPLRKTADGWQGVWSAAVVAPELTDSERLVFGRLAATRGEVLGQDGAQIAYNQQAMKVGIDKARLEQAQWESSARALVGVINASGLSLDADAYVAKVNAAGPKAFVEAAVLRLNDPRQKAAVDATKPISGVLRQEVVRPLALSSTFLRPILGVVGEATAEAIEKSGGAVVAGDLVGTSGLQAARDEVLRGQAGYVVQAVGRDGGATRDLERVEARPGSDVTTTIDIGLQQAAENLLSSVGPASSIVAVRPSDGQILVAASGPGSNGYSTATLGQYPPGSTFKTVSGLAMIRHGLTPDSDVSCPANITVDGYTFDNFDGFPAGLTGTVSWRTAFANSCNTAVIGQRDTVSQADLASAAEALGLTAAPALVIPAAPGVVPAEAASQTEHAASMIGQGRVLASPLGMATVAASIAHGSVVRPVLVLGDAASTVAPAAEPAAPLTEAEAEQLQTLMRAVVTEGGAQEALAGTPGEPVLAKTGTATYTADGQKAYHTWIIAIQGDLAVSVFVADGVSGAKTSGPLLKAFLTAANG